MNNLGRTIHPQAECPAPKLNADCTALGLNRYLLCYRLHCTYNYPNIQEIDHVQSSSDN